MDLRSAEAAGAASFLRAVAAGSRRHGRCAALAHGVGAHELSRIGGVAFWAFDLGVAEDKLLELVVAAPTPVLVQRHARF